MRMQAHYGEQVDFANTRLALERRLQPNIEWNINEHVLLRLQHTKSTLTAKTGQRIFEADLTDLRVTWQKPAEEGAAPTAPSPTSAIPAPPQVAATGPDPAIRSRAGR